MGMQYWRVILALLVGGPASAALAGIVPGSSPLTAPPLPPLASPSLPQRIFEGGSRIYGKPDRASKSPTLAEVDGRTITLADVSDLIRTLPNSLRALAFEDLLPDILDPLIKRQALVIRAYRTGLDEDPDIRRKMRAVSDQVLAQEVLRIEAGRRITEAALLDRYKRDFAGKPGPDEVRLRVIMLPTEQDAVNVITRLHTGADFAAFARQYSQDPTAAEGGDLGYLSRDQMTPEIGAAAFLLDAGEMTTHPVRSAGKWYVLRVEDRRSGPTPAFSVVRAQLVAALTQEYAAEIMQAAMVDVVVRTYAISGQEAGEAAGETEHP